MSPFNVRVYGILINDKQQVLLSDEIIGGNCLTKFPGGGLEFGEGTRDCLAREFKEETGLDVTVGDHLYTTDYFQPSFYGRNGKTIFPEGEQIISIYYWVHCNGLDNFKTADQRYHFSEEQLSGKAGGETFRWADVRSLSSEELSLPIDKIVAGKITRSGA